MKKTFGVGVKAGLLAFLGAGGICIAGSVLMEWSFERPGNVEGWGNANHLADIDVRDGALVGRIMDWDPFISSPEFSIEASAWQAVEIRMRTDCGGKGEIFWTNTKETEYGGFSPGKETAFKIIGDNEWHEYRIFPFWQKEKRIILLRLDFARPPAQYNGKRSFAVDWVRIVSLARDGEASARSGWTFGAGAQGWEPVPGARMRTADGCLQLDVPGEGKPGIRSPALGFSTYDSGYWLAVEMAVTAGKRATLRWASDTHSGLAAHRFEIIPDGEMHLYNVDMGGASGWDGAIFYMELLPSDVGEAEARIASLTVSHDPLGPARVEVRSAGLSDAITRVGMPLRFSLSLLNVGGAVCEDLRVTSFRLPAGVRVSSPSGWRRLPVLEPFDPVEVDFELAASAPVSGPFSLELTGAGAPRAAVGGSLRITASLGLPKAAYVPEPKPVDSDYEIGALYFPGWPTIDRWARIWPTAPERKPVLGWYDEGNPECVDWQIKWAVENGIEYFLVDWYWSAGNQHLAHWIKAFKKARYRRYLKWAMMWANHNRPGSHSEADQRKVTQFWIENYFSMPEYYRIEDKPVVMIWSPRGMDRDMKAEGGVKRLLDVSREMARAAGYKGIWFIAMKWPEASTAPEDVTWLRDAGFDMTSLYHYMHHGGKAENPRHFPFDLVAESSYPWWQARHETGILPFIPNLSTGWDSRPWHGARATVIHGRTVPLFRRICEDAKRFADESGIRRMVLAPLNEWGEGSYAEPNLEFGFGMYEAVREVFCKRPSGGWPLNYGPTDVGLGPYDLPLPDREFRSEWTFSDGSQGWSPMMGTADFRAADGVLVFRTVSHDPAVHIRLERTRARAFRRAVIRMKLEGPSSEAGTVQLFWSPISGSASEGTSVRVPAIADGQFHDYELLLAENPRWRGRVGSLRLDPCSSAGMRVTIDSIALKE